jgi:hypothetical protein
MEDETKEEEEAKYRYKYFLSSIGPSRPLQMFSSDRLNMKREYRLRCDPKKHVIGNLLLSSKIGVWEPVNCC